MKESRSVRRRVCPCRFAVAAVALLVAAAGFTSPASAQTITEFPIPTEYSYPWGIASGPDGNLWFTEVLGNKIGRITPSGVITEFAVPTSNCYPQGITAGPDGNVWFTETLSNKIGRITPSGVIAEFVVPTSASSPYGIAAGPDGNLWFTEYAGQKIGRISPSGAGIVEFPVISGENGPLGIVAGPDGNLWFTELLGNRIGRITPSGSIYEFPIPTGNYGPGNPEEITAGPDGNLWFTLSYAIPGQGNSIGRVTLSGVISVFPAPIWGGGESGIAAGPDGNLWFGEEPEAQIGQMTPAGTMITEFPVPSGYNGSGPFLIAAGPDGNLWFTESNANKIGRLTIPVRASFFTVSPCRAFDSRTTSPLAGGSQTPVYLFGQCGIPAGATAVALNLTVTEATTTGHVSLFADGGAQPLASTINYVAGQTRATNAVASLGASGATAVYVSQTSGTVHVLIDVAGYFVRDTATPSP
jgi:streptogramin lyase